jgi:hypothetical protein
MNRLTVAAPFSYKSHACIGISLFHCNLFFWHETKLLFFCYWRDGYLWRLLPPRNLFFQLPMVRIKLHSQQANVQLFHKYTLSKTIVFDDWMGRNVNLGGSSSMSNFWASLCMPVLSSRHLFKCLKRKEVINVCKRKNRMWLKITWDWNLVAYLKKVLWSSGISVASQ